MTITAKIVADSISDAGIRLTTLELTYPRFIHAEFMTHRVFSRNASSSRAIPTAKMIEQVRTDPAMPIHWGKNQPGMQANEELTGGELAAVKLSWGNAARKAADLAETMAALGAHKQVVNRILEPFQHIHVIVTATEWTNFFALRNHDAAEPNIRALAQRMLHAVEQSEPTLLEFGNWHMPYVHETEARHFNVSQCVKLSTARCARVSYRNHDGTHPDPVKDVELYERLVGSKPWHASPLEHQATPDVRMRDFDVDYNGWVWINQNLHGNLVGWCQHRKFLELGVDL